MKKALRIIGITVLSIIGIVAIGLGVVAVKSPGKLAPLAGSEGNPISGALAEKGFIELGGVRQGYFIRSENPDNPVILFLHGGPGSPELPMIAAGEGSERLEKYFTVCYWDQRGAGMSYTSDLDPPTMTVAQMVEDTRLMSEYLKTRFGQQKIFLVGHSWGSFLGVKTILKYPDSYAAYIGIGQVTNQLKSEKLAYDYMLQHAIEIADRKAIKSLGKFDRAAADFPSADYLMGTRTMLMNKYGIGLKHVNGSLWASSGEFLFFDGYTFLEKMNYLRGAMLSYHTLWGSVMRDNLLEEGHSFSIPVYIVQGLWDYQTSQTLAREWFDGVKAPAKGFFTFEGSAHSPNMEEPQRFVSVVRDIALSHKVTGN